MPIYRWCHKTGAMDVLGDGCDREIHRWRDVATCSRLLGRDPPQVVSMVCRTLARISHTTNREVTVWVTGSRFRLILCFRSAPIAVLARGESRRQRLHGLRVETGARHRFAAALALLARRFWLKWYRGHDAPWRRLPCMDNLRPWRT